MATRSTIAVEYEDGRVQQIYCHWDGYPTHNGMLLLKHWDTHAKVAQLMELGDLSSLNEEIGQQHDFNSCEHPGWCTAYGRDRGETGCEARQFDNFKDYLDRVQFEEYNYILRADGVWQVAADYDFRPLAEVLADELHRQKMEEQVDN